MKRLAVLVAALAVVALAGAAATFGSVDGPAVTGDGTDAGPLTATESPPPTGAPGGIAGGAVERVATPTTAAASDAGGVSPFVVPAVGGSLFAAGLLVVFLTGHDERAPAVPGDSLDDDPTPAVDPEYRSPEENSVTRAWRTLRERAGGDESATPGDVAARALDRHLPAESVAAITERFRAVRYGGERPPADRPDRAAEAAAALDSSSDDADATDGETR